MLYCWLAANLSSKKVSYRLLQLRDPNILKIKPMYFFAIIHHSIHLLLKINDFSKILPINLPTSTCPAI